MNNNSIPKMNNTAGLLATASRFAIAAAIDYFDYQLAQINQDVAFISQSVDQVSNTGTVYLIHAKA